MVGRSPACAWSAGAARRRLNGRACWPSRACTCRATRPKSDLGVEVIKDLRHHEHADRAGEAAGLGSLARTTRQNLQVGADEVRRSSSLARRSLASPAVESSLAARAIRSAVGVRGARACTLVPGRSRLIDARVHRPCTGSASATISRCSRLIHSGVNRTATGCPHARRRRSSGSRRTGSTTHGNTRRCAVDHRRGSRWTSDTARRNTRRRAVDRRWIRRS
jgi:hypothetical protein